MTSVKERFHYLAAAMRFLTIIPVPFGAENDHLHFAKTPPLFPLVGALIGLGAILTANICMPLLPQSVVAALILAYYGAISGFLHLDGLADSCDGLLSARPAARSLEIMKDSSTGAMGVVGVFTVLLIKYSALAAIPASHFNLALFSIPIAGRCSILFAMACQKYCRKEGGLGGLFYSSKSRLWGIGAAIGLTLLLAIRSPYFAGISILIISFQLALFARFCHKRIGGATGDTLGASCELTEMAMALIWATTIS